MHSLGETIAYQIMDFSEGDFSKFGNKIRKGALGSLAALMMTTSMTSCSPQLKSSVQDYTTKAKTAISRAVDSTGEWVSEAKDKVVDVSKDIGLKVSNAWDKTKDKTAEIGSKVSDVAKEAVDRVTGKGK